MTKSPVLYIDADIILHRAVSFVDGEFDDEEVNDWKQGLHYFDYILDKWLSECGDHSDYYLVLSVGPNFRKDLYPEYKANRKDIKPHPSFHDLREEIKERMSSVWQEGIEADDLIGIRVTEDPNTIAVSADKDFATVPCTHVIPTSHGRTKPIRKQYSEGEANLNWLRQAMTGDSIDNYPGIRGIGPKKAEKILPHALPVDKMWPLVEQAFGDPEQALLMARLARILRAGEYDFDKQEVVLWTPNL